MFVTQDVSQFYNMANKNDMRRFVNVMSNDKKARPTENIPSVLPCIVPKFFVEFFTHSRGLPRRCHGR